VLPEAAGKKREGGRETYAENIGFMIEVCLFCRRGVEGVCRGYGSCGVALACVEHNDSRRASPATTTTTTVAWLFRDVRALAHKYIHTYSRVDMYINCRAI